MSLRDQLQRGPWRRRACAALLAGALGLGAGAGASAASPAQLADADAKAEFAYLTEDRKALERLRAELRPYRDSEQPAELYAYAHAEFRTLQLAFAAHAARAAEDAAAACLAALERRASRLSQDPEGLALSAGCAGYLAELGALKHLTAGRRRDASLEAARAQAPANPRVLLVYAITEWFRATTPAQRLAARPGFERAAQAFDTIVVSAPGEPTWGGAEAWLFVGRALEEQGDLVGARSAYERALLVAPDFAAARRRLARLSGRR
jgi:tetratricopeptide (TPR) repeat protein